MNPTKIHEDMGLILGLTQKVKDPVFLLAGAAVTLTQHQSWKLPYAAGVAKKKKKKKNELKTKQKQKFKKK